MTLATNSGVCEKEIISILKQRLWGSQVYKVDIAANHIYLEYHKEIKKLEIRRYSAESKNTNVSGTSRRMYTSFINTIIPS